jgi:sugar/nucleoside kinase (ribokinase family)
MAKKKIGLIGTITHDRITFASGDPLEGLGGVLYQAGVLSGLDIPTILYTNLGQELEGEAMRLLENWLTLQTTGVRLVPGPGNRVHLHYPDQGERVEVLEHVVPPLDPGPVLADVPELAGLIAVLNSGYDVTLPDWRTLVDTMQAPVWLDIHSLALSRSLNAPRTYRALPEWKDWAAGITYLQANAIEIACMLGDPHQPCTASDQDELGHTAFGLGVSAVFVTAGQKGVRILTPERSWWVGTHSADNVADTTGCGDVFCAGTMAKLTDGYDLDSAARFGVQLATAAVEVAGIPGTYSLAKSWETRK